MNQPDCVIHMFQTDLFSRLCRTNRFEWFLRTVSTDELFSTVVFHDWFLKIFSGQIVRMKCKVMLRKNDFSRLLHTDQCLRTAFWIYFSEQLVKMNKSGKYVRAICFFYKNVHDSFLRNLKLPGNAVQMHSYEYGMILYE